MSGFEKVLQKIMQGGMDANIRFSELCNRLHNFGFQLRIKGSHHIYCRDDIEEIVNLQPLSGKAKQYQVKQVRNIILKYKLAGEDDHG
jgi:predicted RNA binding protein YcfA (HicA-like mRNA interferase family)